MDGKVVEGRYRPSSDTPTHLVIYKAFTSIGGVAHTHSSHATAWAQAGRSIPNIGTTHADTFHDYVPVTGEIPSDRIRDAYEAEAPVVALELDMEALQRVTRPARDYVDVPEFPPVSVDLAFVVDEDVTNERLVQVITSAGGKLLEDVRLFDVYRDVMRVGAGKKSMAYALTFRAPDRTLTSEEIDAATEKLKKKVAGATGAEVRG